jgi:hypothetical protein
VHASLLEFATGKKYSKTRKIEVSAVVSWSLGTMMGDFPRNGDLTPFTTSKVSMHCITNNFGFLARYIFRSDKSNKIR